MLFDREGEPMRLLAESSPPGNEVSNRWLVRPRPRTRPLGAAACFLFVGRCRGVSPLAQRVATGTRAARGAAAGGARIGSVRPHWRASRPWWMPCCPPCRRTSTFRSPSSVTAWGRSSRPRPPCGLARQGVRPLHLVVSASPACCTGRTPAPPSGDCRTGNSLPRSTAATGVSLPRILRDTELMAFLLPMLRADVTALETYRSPAPWCRSPARSPSSG